MRNACWKADRYNLTYTVEWKILCPASRQHLRSASRRQQYWSCRATGSAPTAEGHLPWPVRRCGTLCLAIWEFRLLAVIASDARWKRFCLRRTETCSAFGVLRYALYKFTFTYLLTYRGSGELKAFWPSDVQLTQQICTLGPLQYFQFKASYSNLNPWKYNWKVEDMGMHPPPTTLGAKMCLAGMLASAKATP